MTASQIFAFSIFFVLIAFFGMLIVLETILAPLSFGKLVRAATGLDFKPLMEKDQETKKAFRSFVSFAGSALLGSNGLTFALAWMAFHNSNALAWLSLWYWPIMFVWHLILNKRGTASWYFQIIWIILSVTALL